MCVCDMCAPVGHVLAFGENTCLLSDEHVCVCVCMYVCSRVHICVFTCPHVCVFHVYAHVCSNWARVFVPG